MPSQEESYSLCTPPPTQTCPHAALSSERLPSVVGIFQPPSPSALAELDQWQVLAEHQRVGGGSRGSGCVPPLPVGQSCDTIRHHCPIVMGTVTALHSSPPQGAFPSLVNCFSLDPTSVSSNSNHLNPLYAMSFSPRNSLTD